jgi:alpha-galactosidase
MLQPGHNDVTLGGTTFRFSRCARTGIVEFAVFPAALAPRLVTPREFDTGPHMDGLPARWRPQYAHQPEWLVQFKLAGAQEVSGFQAGRSMRGAPELSGLSFKAHTRRDLPDGGVEFVTELEHIRGFLMRHVVQAHPAKAYFLVHAEFINSTREPQTLEYLPTFSLGGITPFHSGEAPERLYAHRMRTAWSAEGRHEALPLESLGLERAWIGASRRTERFGQVGSQPVRGFFPWVAIEDRGVEAWWGAQLYAPGSWHLEIARCRDRVTLSGGPPSRDLGDWWKTIAPGESFATPPAILATVHGDLDDLCHALTSAQIPAVEQQPESEGNLPIVFNEWCTTWGKPTRQNVETLADRLVETATRYLVIDDGWAAKPEGSGIQCSGDWIVDQVKFPQGLVPIAKYIRERGMVPGLWFEWEVANRGSVSFAREDLHLRRNGVVVQVGNRHFLDLRKPEVVEHLMQKLVARLRDDGFGYLKVDYNDTLPSGVDGAESPGEGLRQHLEAVQAFMRRLREEIPGLVIENCASGGHRLEPSFMALCAMGSFSDAHETVSIPIIAANLHRLILPRQSQIWCVLHATDSLQRMRYGLTATMLGRMALSGDLHALDNAQIDEVKRAQRFYAAAAPIIRDGRSRIVRDMGVSWNEPRGWQAVTRHTDGEMLVVVHVFAGPRAGHFEIPLPSGTWVPRGRYADADATVAGPMLRVRVPGDFSGAAFHLRRVA